MRAKNSVLQLLFWILAVAVFLVACSGGVTSKNETEKVTVYAAASLTEVINEIADSFELSTGIPVQISLASSGTLARQIAQGESPNIYISANVKWADYIDGLGYIEQPFRTELAYNTLVFIAPKNSKVDSIQIQRLNSLNGILGNDRLSIGDPKHVPAGKYAMQALDYYNWSEGVNGKLLPAKDVRTALMVVELAESPLGIVYATDAMKSKKVKIVGDIPEESYDKITYVSAVCKRTDEALRFYAFLKSDHSKTILATYGFKN